jgi:hypothetical protein
MKKAFTVLVDPTRTTASLNNTSRDRHTGVRGSSANPQSLKASTKRSRLRLHSGKNRKILYGPIGLFCGRGVAGAKVVKAGIGRFDVSGICGYWSENACEKN